MLFYLYNREFDQVLTKIQWPFLSSQITWPSIDNQVDYKQELEILFSYLLKLQLPYLLQHIILLLYNFISMHSIRYKCLCSKFIMSYYVMIPNIHSIKISYRIETTSIQYYHDNLYSCGVQLSLVKHNFPFSTNCVILIPLYP